MPLELHRWESGSGTPVLCVHETGATAEVWQSLAEAVGDRARTIAFDRRGWGRSEAPEPYARTTVGEQAEDAAAVLQAAGGAAALLCGAGLGAVVVLDLLLRRPELSRGAVLIEPPLLALVPEATELLSADRQALTDAVREGGPESGLDLYLSGSLVALGPGTQRLPGELADRARPLTLFAELGAVPAWSLPFTAMRRTERPSRIVVNPSTPRLVRRAAEELASRLAGTELGEIGAGGLPHLDGSAELAELMLELA